jgi:hypothetical protein
MRNKGTFMTQTIQPRSRASLNEEGGDLTINKGETEDNMSLMYQVLDSLNDLCWSLNRLNCIIERRIMELNMSRKSKGEKNEN